MLGFTETEIKMLASGLGALLLAIIAGWKGLKKETNQPTLAVPEQTALDVDAVLRILNDLIDRAIDHQENVERVLDKISEEQGNIRRETSIILDRMKR